MAIFKTSIPVFATILSFALYLFFDNLDIFTFEEHGTSIVENIMSTANFRNALFGIFITVLAYLWFKKRCDGHTETGKPSDIEAGKSKSHKWSELPFVLLVVVTFVALVMSELPGIIGNLRVGFGTEGLFLEPVDPQKNAGQEFFSYSMEAQDSERAFLATLGHLELLADPPKNLMERDAERICILMKKKKNVRNPRKLSTTMTICR